MCACCFNRFAIVSELWFYTLNNRDNKLYHIYYNLSSNASSSFSTWSSCFHEMVERSHSEDRTETMIFFNHTYSWFIHFPASSIGWTGYIWKIRPYIEQKTTIHRFTTLSQPSFFYLRRRRRKKKHEMSIEYCWVWASMIINRCAYTYTPGEKG